MISDAFDSFIYLCFSNDEFTDSELVEQLQLILETNSGAVHERSNLSGMTLLHYAAIQGMSVDFCQLLIDHSPELIRTPDNNGALPFHSAFNNDKCKIDLFKFLFQQYPECIKIPDSYGCYPIHRYLLSGDDELELLQFLLQHDKGAVSIPDDEGEFPLHIAIRGACPTIDIVREVFNAYPEAVYSENKYGETPLDIALRRRDDEGDSFFDDSIFGFLESQIELANEARQITTRDGRGQLPIHRALRRSNTSLGAIKLMVNANPASLSVADNDGMIPLHIASRFGLLSKVKILIETNKASLSTCDLRGNFALHHACLWHNLDGVSFLLTQTTYGASLRNSDGKLPIEILLYKPGNVLHRDTQEFTEAVFHLLCAYPAALVELAEYL